jgi:tetratricopeptide (TPR) repeat protein
MRQIFGALALLIAVPLVAQLADGDAHWAARAKPGEIDAAIAAYTRAVAAAPKNLEPRWKLMRALRFKGQYIATSEADKKSIYTQAKKQGEEALHLLGLKGSEQQIANAAKSIPGAGEVYLWDAVNWGEWALVYGKMAAVREGAADRIRRESTIAMLIDPRLEGGAPARVLGRLHDQTPHVPFLTGWASEKEALKYLNESLKIDPANKLTKVFLAEALVNDRSSNGAKAIQLLREVVSAPNAAGYEVEDTAATNDAKALLKKWGA